MHLDGPTLGGGGGVGEGVLTELFLDAGLERRGGELYDGGVSLADIARAHGTPAYVYNAEVIRRQFRALDEALAPVPHRICFAVKANSNLGVLRVLRDLGAGADIVSEGEMARALAVGFAPERIVFSGVGKREEELRAALEAGVGHVNVESEAELELLAALADGSAASVPVGIRVNPDVTADTHPYISTGKRGSKFGVPLDQVRPAARRIAAHPRLELVALAMHLGSQLTDVQPFVEGTRRMVDLVRAVRADGTGTLRELDLGGGLGIRYEEEVALAPQAFAAAILPLVRDDGPDTLSRARALSRRVGGHPPLASAVPEALRREGIRHR